MYVNLTGSSVSVIIVNPSLSSATSLSHSDTTPTQSSSDISTSISSADVHHSTPLPSSSPPPSRPAPPPSSRPAPSPSSSPMPLPSPPPSRVRPSHTTHVSFSTSSNTPIPSFTIDDIPDPDKEKQNSSGHFVTCSLTIIHLLTTFVIVLFVVLL